MEEEGVEKSQKEGLLVPLPTQSSGVVSKKLKRDSAKWAALDAPDRAQLIPIIRAELLPK